MPAPTSTRTGDLKTSARRHPVAALLMILSLMVGSGGAAAARQAGDPAARVGRERPGAAAAFAHAPERRLVSDDASEAKPKSSLPPPTPAVVTDLVGTRRGGDASPDTGLRGARQWTASYRARAPPAA